MFQSTSHNSTNNLTTGTWCFRQVALHTHCVFEESLEAVSVCGITAELHGNPCMPPQESSCKCLLAGATRPPGMLRSRTSRMDLCIIKFYRMPHSTKAFSKIEVQSLSYLERKNTTIPNRTDFITPHAGLRLPPGRLHWRPALHPLPARQAGRAQKRLHDAPSLASTLLPSSTRKAASADKVRCPDHAHDKLGLDFSEMAAVELL